MKGQIYANPTFINKNIRKPIVFSIKPLVAYDQSRLFYNNHSIKWELNNIVNCTYSQVFKILFILTDNYKMHVYNQSLELINILNNWEPKYVVGFQLLQNLNCMLLIGTEQIQIMKIKIITNIKKTKFLSSTKLHIKKEQHLIVESENRLKWNKGYNYQIQEDLLYVWSLQDIHFFSLKKLSLKIKITNLTKKQLAISTVYFSCKFKYTITGLMNGDIKVWRLPLNTLYHHKEILIHNFSYHSKEVDQIIKGIDDKTIISYSQDMYVCFSSIETFQVLRIFDFAGQYTKIFLFNHLMAYGIKDQYLGQLTFGQDLQFITELTGCPIYYDSSPHNTLQQEGQYNRLQLTLSSNLAIQINLNDISNNVQANKIQIINIYPPLKSKNIVQLISCPFYHNVFYVLVQDGDIYRVFLQGTSGRINGHYIISKLYDSSRHLFNQDGNYIAFLHIVPPQIDTEIIERTIDKTFNNSYNSKLKQYNQLKLLTIGTSRGSIIFVKIDKMQEIYARLSYHRQKILKIVQVHNKINKIDWIVSICQQKHLKMINFENNRGNCIYSIFCGALYVNIYAFQSNLAFIFPKGIFQIAKFHSYQSIPTITYSRQSINHQQQILSLHYRQDLKLLITSAKDNKVKIWTVEKILLYEIILNQGLQYCLWSSKMNILVMMYNKLYCLRNLPIHFKTNQLQQIQQQFYNGVQEEDIVSLTEKIEEQMKKSKQKLYKLRTIKNHKSLHQSPVINRSSRYKQQITKNHSQKVQVKPQRKKSYVFSTDKQSPILKKKNYVKTQISYQQSIKTQNDMTAIRKHLEQMAKIKKRTHETVLPMIKQKNEDVFVQFMRQKLLNKRLLTRRDITLNRIIIKNIIKDHLGDENEIIKAFKLQ